MTPRAAIPRSWTDYLTDGLIGVGKDLGTTTNKKSNPSSITVVQKEGRIYHTRLNVTWKTNDPDVSEQMLECVLDDIKDAQKRIRRTCLDASNEVFFATRLKKKFVTFCPFDLVKGGEKVEHMNERMDSKTLLGNIYINLFDDALITLPLGDSIKNDHRLVMRDRGSFTTNLGRNGEHGDTFDSGKLAVWALESGSERIKADAMAVGGLAKNAPLRAGLVGPIGKKVNRFLTRLNS